MNASNPVGRWLRGAVALGLTAAPLIVGCPSLAQPITKEQSAAEQRAVTDGARTRWLKSMEEFDLASASSRSLPSQIASMVGREDLVGHWQSPPKSPVCTAQFAAPIQEIVRRARDTSIVIISERHDAPQHRKFAADLIRDLRDEGYSYFAAETFFAASLDLPDALLTDGYYTQEPEFGREVALAKSLGYRLIAYEQTEEQSRASPRPGSERPALEYRQANQAGNIVAALPKGEPRPKVIVHAGGAYERSGPDDPYVLMAERLKELTGIDPVTVMQGDCSAPGSGIVLTEDPLGSGSGRADLYVGHPRMEFRNGRPAWRQDAGQIPTSLPPALTFAEPIIIEARPAEASLQVVPSDRLYLRADESLPLLLYPGQYRIDAWTQGGKLRGQPIIITAEAAGPR